MGKLDDAEADLSLALRLDAELPMSLTEPVSRAVLCEIRLDRGDLDAAREAITLDLERYEGTLGVPVPAGGSGPPLPGARRAR